MAKISTQHSHPSPAHLAERSVARGLHCVENGLSWIHSPGEATLPDLQQGLAMETRGQAAAGRPSLTGQGPARLSRLVVSLRAWAARRLHRQDPGPDAFPERFRGTELGEDTRREGDAPAPGSREPPDPGSRCDEMSRGSSQDHIWDSTQGYHRHLFARPRFRRGDKCDGAGQSGRLPGGGGFCFFCFCFLFCSKVQSAKQSVCQGWISSSDIQFPSVVLALWE